MKKSTEKYYQLATILAIFTIAYNIIEGFLAAYLGYQDDSLTLFGFGSDSFIESISGIGILHMVSRIKRNPTSSRDEFEKVALQITGVSFYLLSAGLVISAGINTYMQKQPDTTWYGAAIGAVSILVMLILVYYKNKVGRALNSPAILADAACTRVCIYMSVVLLLSSGIYYLFQWPYLDSIGAVLIAYFSFNEGRECFEKATSDKHCGCD